MVKLLTMLIDTYEHACVQLDTFTPCEVSIGSIGMVDGHLEWAMRIKVTAPAAASACIDASRFGRLSSGCGAFAPIL